MTVTDMYKEKRVRNGKTKRDHQTGAWARRFANRDTVSEWIKDSKARNETFPGHLCKGKGNSSKAYKVKPGKQSK